MSHGKNPELCDAAYCREPWRYELRRGRNQDHRKRAPWRLVRCPLHAEPFLHLHPDSVRVSWREP